MGGATFVVVKDADWRFEPELVFDALRQAYVGRDLWRGSDPCQLRAEGFADGWEVDLDDELTAFIIKAPPAPTMELVAWVRAFVPAEVPLDFFDDQLTFDVRPLPVGVSVDQLRSDYWPDASKVEQMSAKEPPTLEQRLRSGPPPHVAELMGMEQPPGMGSDPE